mgnify:CR=1 FL=1
MAHKRICFSIPCYNEKENIIPMVEQIFALFQKQLSYYDCTIQIIDNCSTDGTVEIIRQLCSKYSNVRAILNAKNFPGTSGYWGLLSSEGDCTISIPCDFQVPVELIPLMLDRWEKGAKIVCMTKKGSEENPLMLFVRKLYYKVSSLMSDVEIIPGFSGYGLYDKSFLDLCRTIDDRVVSFGQLVATLGYDREQLQYIEKKRKTGKSKNNLFSLIQISIVRITNASTILPRFAMALGVILGMLSLLIGLVYFVLKMLFWYQYPAGLTPVLLGVFFLGGIQLFFIGIIGEYIIKANIRLMNRPLVIERERLNFNTTNSVSREGD